MPQVTYTVEMDELEEVQARLRRYPEIERAVVVPGMKKVAIEVAKNVGRRAPVYRTRLKAAIIGSPKVERLGGEVVGVVDAGNLGYAQAMEEGMPAAWPNMAELSLWVRRTLGDERLVGAIAQAIAEGRSRLQRMRGYRMFSVGFAESVGFIKAEFERMRDEIVKRIANGG